MKYTNYIAIVLVVSVAGCRMPPLKRVPPGPVTKYDALMVAIQLYGSVASVTDPAKRKQDLNLQGACFKAWSNWRSYRFAKISAFPQPELERRRIVRFLVSSVRQEGLPPEYLTAIAQALAELDQQNVESGRGRRARR